jgi:tight adherence protein B
VLQALRGLSAADVGPAGAVFAGVASRVDRGESVRDALDALVGRHPVHAVRLAAAALLVGADTGAAPARAVEGVAATLRDHAALEREAAALATQGRASAAVLVLAPVGFGAFAVLADPRVATFLFRTAAGLACLVSGAALDALGAWWMSRLVRSAR